MTISKVLFFTLYIRSDANVRSLGQAHYLAFCFPSTFDFPIIFSPFSNLHVFSFLSQVIHLFSSSDDSIFNFYYFYQILLVRGSCIQTTVI